jgi:Zn finger protein HypA/HybF involved in hydrogenase expression
MNNTNYTNIPNQSIVERLRLSIVLINAKCQCGKESKVYVTKEEAKQTIYINEQPCNKCGHYMTTIIKS